MPLGDTCNFLATFAPPPWTKPLRHNLYVTLDGEERTPFSLYVQPSTSSATTSSSCQNISFSLFNVLPAELQLRVLTFCSASTLFQLMRVSSSLRIEASKLFWAHPDAYFVVEAAWLLCGDGYAGHTDNDLAFLEKVQNVQIQYCHGAHYGKICPHREVQQDQIERFWKIFQVRCPTAKRMIINQNWMPRLDEEETHSVSRALQHLVRSSPSKIKTCAFVVVDEDANIPAGDIANNASLEKRHRAVYEPRPDGSWKKTQSGQNWKTILVPAKPFLGPVGQFCEPYYIWSLFLLEEDGLWATLVETLDRYHFDVGRNQPFSCPLPRCDAHFEKAGEWTIHAAEFHHQERIKDVMETLPEAMQSEFKERQTRLVEKGEKIQQGVERTHEEWERAGEAEIRRLWQEQLENDPLWETEAEDLDSNPLWDTFLRNLPGDG